MIGRSPNCSNQPSTCSLVLLRGDAEGSLTVIGQIVTDRFFLSCPRAKARAHPLRGGHQGRRRKMGRLNSAFLSAVAGAAMLCAAGGSAVGGSGHEGGV